MTMNNRQLPFAMFTILVPWVEFPCHTMFSLLMGPAQVLNRSFSGHPLLTLSSFIWKFPCFAQIQQNIFSPWSIPYSNSMIETGWSTSLSVLEKNEKKHCCDRYRILGSMPKEEHDFCCHPIKSLFDMALASFPIWKIRCIIHHELPLVQLWKVWPGSI